MAPRKRIRLPADSYAMCDAFSVTIATSRRDAVFSDKAFALTCIEILRELRLQTGCPVFAYCLMPDHVHLLIGTTPTTPLPSFIGAWKSRTYQARRLLGFGDRFWQRSFFDHAVRTREDLRAAAMYVLGNPVRAGLVEEFHEYPLCGSMEFDL